MAIMAAEEITIKVWRCRCEQCGRTWTTTGPDLPRRCPNHDCRSTIWNAPKMPEKKRPGWPRGRPRKKGAP